MSERIYVCCAVLFAIQTIPPLRPNNEFGAQKIEIMENNCCVLESFFAAFSAIPKRFFFNFSCLDFIVEAF